MKRFVLLAGLAGWGAVWGVESWSWTFEPGEGAEDGTALAEAIPDTLGRQGFELVRMGNVTGNERYVAWSTDAAVKSVHESSVYADETPPAIWSGGTHSLRFSDSGGNKGGYLGLANAAEVLGLGGSTPFTLEFFFKTEAESYMHSRLIEFVRPGGSYTLEADLRGSNENTITNVNVRCDMQTDNESPSGKPGFNIAYGGGNLPIVHGRWHHFAVAYRPEEDGYYLDLHLDGRKAWTGKIWGELRFEGSELRVGRRMVGRIDYLRITKKALGEEELLWNFAMTRAERTKPLLAHWRFEREAGEARAEAVTSEANAEWWAASATYGQRTEAENTYPHFEAAAPDRAGVSLYEHVGGKRIGSSAGCIRFRSGEGKKPSYARIAGSYAHAGGDFTMECFFKAPAGVAIGDYVTFLRRGRRDAAAGVGEDGTEYVGQGGLMNWALGFDKDNKLRLRADSVPCAGVKPVNTGNWNQCAVDGAGGSVTDGKWHHLALTYVKAERKLRLWVDYGERPRLELTTAYELPLNPDDTMNIGSEHTGGAFDYWLDEVRYTEGALEPGRFMRWVYDAGTRIVVR